MSPRQGSLQLVRIRSDVPLAEVTGRWNGNEIPFWKASDENVAGLRIGLLGVDLEHDPGNADFSVSGTTAAGEPVSCTAPLTVERGQFATEKLTVPEQYVEPNAEQLARANAERDHLRAIFAQVTPDKLWDGPFRMPITGATTGGNFGKRRILNGQTSSPHSGVDIRASGGTLVHASQSGRIVLAEPLYFSGNTVVIDHGLGVYTLYGHLRSFNVKAGDTVAAGQLIGKVGATGRATGPHLHWGLTVNRARVNSLDIVKLALR